MIIVRLDSFQRFLTLTSIKCVSSLKKTFSEFNLTLCSSFKADSVTEND